MRTIKIFALPSHQLKERTSGVDFARVIQPMKHLNGYTDGENRFEVDIYDIFKQEDFNWKAVAEKYDMVFLNYTVLDWAYAAMGAFVHGKGKKIVLDMDDALWYVNSDNIAHDSLKAIGAGEIITAILKDVDGITTTNLYLKHLIASKTSPRYDRMAVFPNAVDLKLYCHKTKAKDAYPITLFHYGSTSHFNDLSEENFVEGMDRIFKTYPNVVFKAIGANIPKLKNRWGDRYSYGWGDSDIYKWIGEKFPVFMEEADIMVVPLTDNIYNRCKSDIKFIESATTCKPGVFSNIRPYRDSIQHGVTGFIAQSAQDWFDYLSLLIESKEKRQEIGDNAYNYVVAERQIEKLVPEYAKFLLKILNTP